MKEPAPEAQSLSGPPSAVGNERGAASLVQRGVAASGVSLSLLALGELAEGEPVVSSGGELAAQAAESAMSAMMTRRGLMHGCFSKKRSRGGGA